MLNEATFGIDQPQKLVSVKNRYGDSMVDCNFLTNKHCLQAKGKVSGANTKTLVDNDSTLECHVNILALYIINYGANNSRRNATDFFNISGTRTKSVVDLNQI